MGRFEYREDLVPADAAVEAWGEDLGDLFATSARALCELMADPESLGEGHRHAITLAAETPELLLVDFLSELLFLKDRDRALFPRAEVRVERDEAAGPAAFRLEARLAGEVVDPARTRRRIDVKAVTLHGLAVERSGEGWHARFVLDL